MEKKIELIFPTKKKRNPTLNRSLFQTILNMLQTKTREKWFHRKWNLNWIRTEAMCCKILQVWCISMPFIVIETVIKHLKCSCKSCMKDKKQLIKTQINPGTFSLQIWICCHMIQEISCQNRSNQKIDAMFKNRPEKHGTTDCCARLICLQWRWFN